MLAGFGGAGGERCAATFAGVLVLRVIGRNETTPGGGGRRIGWGEQGRWVLLRHHKNKKGFIARSIQPAGRWNVSANAAGRCQPTTTSNEMNPRPISKKAARSNSGEETISADTEKAVLVGVGKSVRPLVLPLNQVGAAFNVDNANRAFR